MIESPRGSSEPVLPGEAGPRLMAAIGRILISELPLALRAAYRLRGRPGIALAVLILASLGFFSKVITNELLFRRLYPEYSPRQVFARVSESYSHTSVTYRWLRDYTAGDPSYALIFRPLQQEFARPLARAYGFADACTRLPRLAFIPPGEGTPAEQRKARVPLIVFFAIAQIVELAVAVAVVVALLGWMLGTSPLIGATELRRNWKLHYWPVFAVVAAEWAISMAVLWPLPYVWARIPHEPLVDAILNVVTAAPVVLLTLAPFVVMGRGVGWRQGIVEGLRLLRRRWLALVTLFVLYRVGYEGLAVWRALPPWPTYRTYSSLSIPAPLAWMWVSEMGLALLGLWLAYAFMEIARQTVTEVVRPSSPASELGL